MLLATAFELSNLVGGGKHGHPLRWYSAGYKPNVPLAPIAAPAVAVVPQS